MSIGTTSLALVDHTSRFLSTSLGRDKANRFVQFFSKFIAWYLSKVGGNPDTIKRLSALSATLSQSRKLMAVGRQLEFLSAISKSRAINDPFLRYATILKSVALMGWLSFDTIQWIHGAGVLQHPDIKLVSDRAMKWWLASLVVSLAGSLYRFRINSNKLALETSSEKSASDGANVKALYRDRASITLAIAQDAFDILIPCSALQYTSLDQGYVAAAGTITSLIGAYVQWRNVQ
ncbi:peroxisomal biogenesis factor 11 [Polychytrium aggregatum]|uniref:peroxisomal biogenesis factor 11 n=1 Tax=Polychytrium aggregatum TaxID=110093 RepID=UPI0022FEA57A|nr:peroxisomal biogenesis factor 11 [Polychytrium aggregatum]KAI9207560.1 peroxisomal biogenesis factor 11 [Polychytrium aggregatum]